VLAGDENKLSSVSPSTSEIFRPGLLGGRVCVVSGAGTGLGRATSFELTSLGATVVGCGRRAEPLEDTVGRIREGGGTAEAVPMDIRDPEAVDALFDGVMERHGRLDVLVNNAGGQFLSPAEAITPKGFRTVTDLNVQGTWQMTHAAATKAFIPQRSGKVISITLSPHQGMPGMAHSGAARAAVENMMRTLSIEWARFGIKTVALAAGHFATETLLTKYPQAIATYSRVINNYKDAEEVAEALMQQGLAYQAVGDRDNARKVYQQLTTKYATSIFAAQAEQKLKQLNIR